MPTFKTNHIFKEDIFSSMRCLLQTDEQGVCKNFENEDVATDWCRARNYVKDQIDNKDKWVANGISISSSEHVHIVIHCTDPMAFYIARQAALMLHFPNFREGNGINQNPKNSTIITLLYNRKKYSNIVKELHKEEYLCNLIDLSKYTLITAQKNNQDNGYTFLNNPVKNPYSFIDIEFELVGFENDDFVYQPSNAIVITPQEINQIKAQKVCKEINVTQALRVNMVYNVGADIDNLPPDDPNTADRYSKALLYFCYQQSEAETQAKWKELINGNNIGDKSYQIQLRNKLSNIICADCFYTRLRSLFCGKISSALKSALSKQGINSKSSFISIEKINNIIKNNEKLVLNLVKSNLQPLAKCEHARWNVEKLILGFSPLSEEEHYQNNRLFGSERNAYRKELKKNHAHHIDLCSYQDLRRINPSDMKYDCFLMMAMVRILKENFNMNEDQN